MADLVLVRHGETEWSRTLRHTGRTDLPLTSNGEAAARALAPALAGRTFALVLTSPLERARRTAELAGLTGAAGPVETDADLLEWDYGGYEGRTTADVRTERPGWYLWDDGVPPGDADHPGETVDAVGARADRVLARCAAALEHGDVVLVGHGHALRVLIARWLGLEPRDGRLFALETAAPSVLGEEHDRPILKRLNVPAR